MLIKKVRSRRSIQREWAAHQKKNDPNYLTRRQLIERGALGYASLFLMPTLGGLLNPKTARGESSFKKLVTLDMSGGAGFGPEVVFLDRNQNFLPSYSTLGNPQNPNTAGTVSSKYGAYLWTSGTLFQRLEANASPAVKAALGIAVIQHSKSQDDSNSNPSLATNRTAQFASQMGGSMRIKSGLSIGSDSTSGGNARSAVEVPGMKPASGKNLKAVQALLSPAAGPLAALSSKMLSAMIDLSGSLSNSARDRLAEQAKGNEVVDTFMKGVADNKAAITNTAVFDPRQDAAIATAFGITAATAETDQRVTLAASVKAVTDGLSPILVTKLNGYDYHNGNANWKTNEHPRVIDMTVQILNAFAAKGESVIIHWNTDGGIKFGNGNENAEGDFNDAHSGLMFVLSMNGAPKMKNFYLGSFTSGQVAESNPALNLLSKNAANEGHAVFANILGLNGVTNLSSYKPDSMTADEFASLNLFA